MRSAILTEHRSYAAVYLRKDAIDRMELDWFDGSLFSQSQETSAFENENSASAGEGRGEIQVSKKRMRFSYTAF
jgi:hypothetical protein